jgi:hypothetical protein
MKKKKNDLKKLKLNKGVISHFEEQQIKGGTLVTTEVCVVQTTDIYLYSKINKPCDTGRYCETKTCEPTQIGCSIKICL